MIMVVVMVFLATLNYSLALCSRPLRSLSVLIRLVGLSLSDLGEPSDDFEGSVQWSLKVA